MDSFDQLIELAYEAKDGYEKFTNTNLDVSVEQAFMNYYKSHQICKEIEDKVNKIEIRKDGSGYGYDKCVYYMTKNWLNRYQYDALVVFTLKLSEEFKQLVERRAENKQKESLKHLIKEAIKEAREEQQKSKPMKITKHSSKRD